MADDEARLPRRLSAVLLADMKDYSALMGEDEAHAIAGVDDIRGVFARVVPRHGGSFEVSSGDCFFAVFDSAVEALEAAVVIQRELAGAQVPSGRPLAIRIGVHLGEVVRTPLGLMGDSINVAARIQSIAEPGGVSVSEDVYRAVRNRLRAIAFRDLGPQTLKNILEPVRVYAVVLRHVAGDGAAPGAPETLGVRPGGRARGAPRIPRRLLLTGGAGAVAVGSLLWRWGPALRDGMEAVTEPRIATPRSPLVLGVMAVRTRGAVQDWMSDFTRDGLNTVLSQQPNLLVFSRQKIDFLREKRGLTEIEAAEQLGISKMVSATLSAVGATLALEVQVIDIGTGLIEASRDTRGSETQLIEMQNDAATEVMRSLKVPIDEVELARVLAKRTNERLDDYKLLTESMGGVLGDETSATEPRSERRASQWFARVWVRPAHASGADEAAIQALLEHYRSALEAESIAEVEALHVTLTGPMRDALHRYFENAERLRVQFSKVDVVVEGNEALATFTRSDDFLDARTGMPVHLEMRVSNVLARENGAWKIRGLRRQS